MWHCDNLINVQLAFAFRKLFSNPSQYTIMVEQPLATVFGSVGVVYGLLVPIVLVILFSFFLIASLISNNANPSRVAQAIFCFVMMGVGILLMTIAALPTVTSVLAGTSYASATYVGLLIVFATGGCIFLWHDHWVHSLDASSRLVPSLIFIYTVRVIGSLTGLLAGLSIVLTLVLGGAEEGWWIMPVALALYGFVLYMSTRDEKAPVPPLFCGVCKVPKFAKPKMPRMPKVRPKLRVTAVAKKATKTKKRKKGRSKKRRK